MSPVYGVVIPSHIATRWLSTHVTVKERRDTVYNEIWVYGDRYLDVLENFSYDKHKHVWTDLIERLANEY